MRKLLIFLVLISSCQLIFALIKCGKRRVGKRVNPLVFGGNFTQEGDWPWMGPIFFSKTNQYFCGSSLISNRHTLTGELLVLINLHQKFSDKRFISAKNAQICIQDHVIFKH